MKYNKFAFDLNGTLIDEKGKLIDGVVELFNNILNENVNPKFLICTGHDIDSAQKTAFEINKHLQHLYNQVPINFAFSASAGAVVVDECGNKLKETHITYDDFVEIEKLSKIIDENSTVLFRDDNNFYYTKPKKISKENLRALTMKIITKLKPISEFKIYPLDSDIRDMLLKNNKIRSLEVLCFGSEKNKAMFDALCKKYNGLTVNASFTIQVSNGSKLESINEVFGKDYSRVMYVGDGYNDIIPMQYCGLSFALGNKSKVLESADVALKQFADVNKVLFENYDYTNESKEAIANAKEKERIKRLKKEQGGLKFAISKFIEGNSKEK